MAAKRSDIPSKKRKGDKEMPEMQEGPTIIKHRLGEFKFNVVPEQESPCGGCFHNKVCKMDMAKFCMNFTWGNSSGEGCGSCTLRFVRYNRDEPLPCFVCRHEAPKER